jgi:hypothetical protein
LRRDRTKIGYGDSIRQFMDEIGASRHVVLVLSEAYFKSEYCMYELCRIHDHGDVRKRVKPLVLTGTSFHKPIDRGRYLKHWETETANLEKELDGLTDPKYTLKLRQALDGYADFRRRMDELLYMLADMNSLREDVHLDSDFAALLDRIAPQLTGKPDDLFRARITDEIRGILAASARLSNALRAALREAGREPSSDLSTDLCAEDLERALEDLLFPATRSALAVLDPRQPEFADTWSVAKSVLAWLSLLAVDSECLVRPAEARCRQASSVSRSSSRPLSASNSSVPAIARSPRGCALQKGTRKCRGRIDPAAVIRNRLGRRRRARRTAARVWAHVFPEESRSTLSAKDLRTLNNDCAFATSTRLSTTTFRCRPNRRADSAGPTSTRNCWINYPRSP